MPEESGGFEAIGKVLPSVYYDLVARVCSGIPVLLALLWGRVPGASEISWPSLFLLARAGYIVGMIITPLSWPWKIVEDYVRGRIYGKGDWGRVYSLADEISSVDKDAGTTLLKMEAEAVLCENLFGAFVVLLILDWLHVVSVPALSTAGALLRGLLFVLFAVASLQRVIAQISREKRLYEIYFLRTGKRGTTGRLSARGTPEYVSRRPFAYTF